MPEPSTSGLFPLVSEDEDFEEASPAEELDSIESLEQTEAAQDDESVLVRRIFVIRKQ